MISDTALRNDLLTNEEPLLFRKWLLLQCATAPADIMAVQCVKQRHDLLSDYIGTKVVKLFEGSEKDVVLEAGALAQRAFHAASAVPCTSSSSSSCCSSCGTAG